MLGITILSFGFQWYCLTYLPVVDCLPYKKGNNISEKMKMPAGAVPDSFAIRFVYEKGGKQFEFSPAELPADLDTYKLISRKDKLIRKGNAEPPVKGFSLSGVTDEDSTQIILNLPYAILLFCEDFSMSVSKWQKGFSEIYSLAKTMNIPAYLITTQPADAPKYVSGTSFADIKILKCDFTAIRTAARTNPCLFILNNGTITGKWSRQHFSSTIKLLEGITTQSTPN